MKTGKIGRVVSAAAVLWTMTSVTPASAQDAYMGQVETFAFNFCPSGWLPADGRLVALNQYQALYSLLGTTYGGNGTTSFALPDLRGRVAIGPGQGPGQPTYRWGQTGGTAQSTLTLNNLPAHSHTAILRAHNAPGTSDNPANGLMADFPDGQSIYAPGPSDVSMSPEAVQIGTTGSSQPVSVMQPYIAMTACIATQGLYPPRP